MRALIVYEDSHRAYGEAMVGAVRASRPGLEEVYPHLVVSSRPNTFEVGGRVAWVLLSDDPEEPSEVCIDGRHRRLENPGLEQILEIIDETEALVRTGRELRGC